MNKFFTCGVLLTVAVTTRIAAAETDFNFPPTISGGPPER